MQCNQPSTLAVLELYYASTLKTVTRLRLTWFPGSTEPEKSFSRPLLGSDDQCFRYSLLINCFNYKLILVLNNESINLLINDWSYHLAWFCRFPSNDGYSFHLSLAYRLMHSIYYEYSCLGQICSIQIQRPAQFSLDWESICMMLTAQISITHCIKIFLPFQN